jgi:hypothetical protein
MRCRLVLPVLLGLAALAVLAAPPALAADPAAVARLIDRLGSPEFAEREQASRELEALGPAVLEPLRQAARGDDLEVRRRAADLVQRLQARVLSEKMLTPTRVRLTYKDVPLRTALEDLQRRTGLRLALHDPENKLAERRVTLDTGDVPLWEAFDDFCRKAGLVEGSPAESRPAPGAVPGRTAVGMAPAGAAAAAILPAVPPPGVPLQAAQVQLQIQAGGQPLTVATMQAVPGTGPASLALVEGKPQPQPSCSGGAVRVRALPPETPVAGLRKRAEELPVVLQVLPEPKLEWRGVLAVHLDRATDDQGQSLTRPGTALTALGPSPLVMAPGAFWAPLPGRMIPQEVAVRLRKGEKPSRSLRELSGTILAQVQAEPETLITVDRVLQSSGRTVKGDQGGLIRVVKAEKADNGVVTLHIQVENPPDVVPAGLRRTAPAPLDAAPVPVPPAGGMSPYSAGHNGLNLLDGKGNPLPLLPLQTQVQSNGAAMLWDYTFLCQPQQDRGEPARLVFGGTRAVTIDIPFTLTDVPLP